MKIPSAIQELRNDNSYNRWTIDQGGARGVCTRVCARGWKETYARKQRSARLFHPENDIHGPPRSPALVKEPSFFPPLSHPFLSLSLFFPCSTVTQTTNLRARLVVSSRGAVVFFSKRNSARFTLKIHRLPRHHAIKREYVGARLE